MPIPEEKAIPPSCPGVSLWAPILLQKYEDKRHLSFPSTAEDRKTGQGTPKGRARELLKRAKEFQPEQALVPQGFQPPDFRLNRRSLAGDKA